MESTSCALETGPLFRVWLCGPLCLERRQAATYEPLPLSAWGGSAYPRQLLKALLCCPRRQAHRERLLAWLWPDAAPDQAASALHTATTKLRKVLQPPGASSLLESLSEGHGYRLPGQALLWVDAEEALQLLQQAEACQRTGDPLAVERLLEEAVRYWQRGTFLEGEEGDWVLARRATHERACYRARWWLSEIYEQQGRWPEAEAVLTELWEEDPTDGEVVARLVTVLLRQGRRQEARRCYRDWRHLLARTGDSLDEQSVQAIERVLHAAGLTESQPSPSPRPASPLPGFLSGPNQGILDMKTLHWSTATDRQRRQLLQTTLEGLGLLALPEFSPAFASEVLERLAFVLQKPSCLDGRTLQYLTQRLDSYWLVMRCFGLPTRDLLHLTLSDLQIITELLSGPLLPTNRQRLCALAGSAAMLAGHLYHDQGLQDHARSYCLLAVSAAHEAHDPVLEAVAWARHSFAWTYDGQPLAASQSIERARQLVRQQKGLLTTWLALIEAEIAARLQQDQRSLQALSEAEDAVLADQPSFERESLWTGLDASLAAGFRGACFLELARGTDQAMLQRARQALEAGLGLPLQENPRVRVTLLIDLARAYVQAHELEAAHPYVLQAIESLQQKPSRIKLQRLLQLRQDWALWQKAPLVTELEEAIQLVAERGG
uniref:Bacterial transcriptional activator domain-containing protein n=1 Tax=Thermogemmatispora argillosa TaxID=2045280 RepID=A0A455SXE6_9CHLR|nr:hypothetical protein KTA_04450 [Thermogemmatispora argillosa]